MLPRVVQWMPGTTVEQLALVLRAPVQDEELAEIPGAQPVRPTSRMYLHAVNVSGGAVTLDDPGPPALVVDVSDSPLDAIAGVARQLVTLCSPFAFLVRRDLEPDGSAELFASDGQRLERQRTPSWITTLVDRDMATVALDLLHQSAQALLPGDPERCLSVLAHAQRVDREDLRFWELTAQAWLELERPDEAELALRTGLVSHAPNYNKADSARLLGRLWSETGQAENSRRAFRMAAQLHRTSGGNLELARAHLALGDVDAARAIATVGDRAKARVLLAAARLFGELELRDDVRRVLTLALDQGASALVRPKEKSWEPDPVDIEWAEASCPDIVAALRTAPLGSDDHG